MSIATKTVSPSTLIYRDFDRLAQLASLAGTQTCQQGSSSSHQAAVGLSEHTPGEETGATPTPLQRLRINLRELLNGGEH